MADKAQLRVGDKTIDLEVLVGTEGERAIDIARTRLDCGECNLEKPIEGQMLFK